MGMLRGEPGVVQMYGFFEDDDYAYIVMVWRPAVSCFRSSFEAWYFAIPPYTQPRA